MPSLDNLKKRLGHFLKLIAVGIVILIGLPLALLGILIAGSLGLVSSSLDALISFHQLQEDEMLGPEGRRE